MQCYLTEYDQSVFKIKIKDTGCEHKWSSFPTELQNGNIKWSDNSLNNIVKTEAWQTFFQLDNLYEKETIYKDLSQKSEDQTDTQDFVGFKEGKNEKGVIWKEDWQKNIRN